MASARADASPTPIIRKTGWDQPRRRQRQEVAESCFQLLLAEYIKTCSKGDSKTDSKTVDARLESVGRQVGVRVAERFTAGMSRFAKKLEKVKFVCKEMWIELFHKQADKLRTNYVRHVLHDFRFPLLTRMGGSEAELAHARRQLIFVCGIIRGALENLGMNVAVTFQCERPPQCYFEIVDKDPDVQAPATAPPPKK